MTLGSVHYRSTILAELPFSKKKKILYLPFRLHCFVVIVPTLVGRIEVHTTKVIFMYVGHL